MEPRDYLAQAGLTLSERSVQDGRTKLWDMLEEVRKASIPATPHALNRLYTFQVPKLSADGTCSLINELEPTPFDLANVLGGKSMRSTLSLMVLGGFVESAVRHTNLDWLGVYQVRQLDTGRSLVKLASRGAPSRAQFPLTDEFAQRSNNVAVALSGKARVIPDVEAHVKAGGAYYECNSTVRSEACLPIFDRAGTIVGVVDAEHSKPNAFDDATLGWVVAIACEAASHLPA